MSNKKTKSARTTQAFLLRLSVACLYGLVFLLLLQTADASKIGGSLSPSANAAGTDSVQVDAGNTGAGSANVLLPNADAVITVTTTADDITPNDGTVSLREAITASNAGNDLGDPDIAAQSPGTFGPLNTINFNIAGAGVKTINVGSSASASGIPLPSITKPVIINGYTQGAASPNTLANADNAVILLRLNGTSAGASANGLTLVSGSSGSTLKGLDITNFSGNGIVVQTNSNFILGNFIGVDPPGTTRMPNGTFPNGGDGIRIANASNNQIGSTSPADRNITSGNAVDGIHVLGTLVTPATGNIIQGNFVGVAADGKSSVGNRTDIAPAPGTAEGNNLFGIEISGGNLNTVGGTAAGARNVVGLNGGGIEVNNGGQQNVIQGNFVGVGADGATPAKNLLHGIALRSSNGFGTPLGPAQTGEPGVSFNVIGGTAAGAGNLVEFNSIGGVAVFGNPVSASGQANVGNAIEGNSIFQNGRDFTTASSAPLPLLGIDLTNGFTYPRDDGATVNDSKGHGAPNDPNNFQNFPVLTNAFTDGTGKTHINGTLSQSVSPNTTFRIEFFANDPDPLSLPAEGQQFLGFVNTTTDGGGNATFTATFNVTVVSTRVVTATATSPVGDTSEFSAAVPVSFSAPLSGTTINAFEGVAFANTKVATLNSFDPSTPASNFTATINWGDGTAFSSGTIVSDGGGLFSVKGSHTYAEEGSFNVTVTVHDIANNVDLTANTAATVTDAPLTITPISAGARTEFSGIGGTNASTTAGTANAAMLAFQAAIGGANNGGNPPPQANGFRTINWDAVGLGATDGSFTNQVIVPNHVVGIPINRFQGRGVQFEEIYAVADDGFTSVNPGVAGQFPAFSPNKTFAMFNDNTIDFSFVLPSSPTSTPVQAVTRGFGAIFLDVETPNTTSIEYFNNGTSLGKFFVPVGSSGQPEFLGELFLNTAITNVHIELGNATLFSFDGTTATSGPADNPGSGTDLAVTDDFVYAEPTVLPTGITINAISGAPFTARVASFTDADPAGQVSDYSALIDWGDGSFSAGTITPNGLGGFDVTGTHTYNSVPHTFTVLVSVSDAGGSRTSGQSAVNVSAQPTLSIGNATVTEGNSGTTNAAFTVTLSSASSQAVTVDYVTSDGTASAPSDYDSQAGTLTFAPGVTTRTINIAVKGDTVPEPNETFFVTLLNPANSTIATAQGIGTINDDDESGFVQFNAATATVAENAGSASLAVTRTGDTSGVTTVNFETSDGTATQKNDYTFGFGTIQFGPGETSKTIQVPIVDDVFVEGPETFKVTLSNASGNFVVGSQNQITVTITDNDSVAPTTNPIDDTTFFVRQHYLDFLGREPDAPGLAFWTGQINSCGANQSCIAAKRVDVSASFFLSIEFQETGGYALRLQRTAFGRQSNDPLTRYPYLQFMRDARTIGQGGVIVGQAGFETLLEQNKQAYAERIVLGTDFTIRFPPAPAAVYVDALFASAGVTPTAAERTAAINAFGAGGTSGRVASLRSVTDSVSVRTAESRISFVLAEYYGYLRRNPTDAPDFNDAGYQFWLNKLNLFNGNYIDAEMVKAFLTSIEYRQRFGP